MGDNFIAVFEVKGLSLNCTDEDKNKFEGCCETALLQRKRIGDLIRSINPSVMIFEFTIFPNISTDEIHVIDETILFMEDLQLIRSTIDACEEFAILSNVLNTGKDKLYRCLLGLWCIDQEGKWDIKKCSLTWRIKDIDQKLRRALVTRKSVDTDKLTASSKKGKAKKSEYPENPGMVEAPKIFKDYLNINCLTQDQLDVFNSTERFLWAEGPAGSGKTIVMLGKILDIVQKEAKTGRILVILPGNEMSAAIKRHLELLENITDCTMVKYEYYKLRGDISAKVAAAQKSFLEQLSNTNSQVVLVRIFDTLFEDYFVMWAIIMSFDYVFVDDYQTLLDKLQQEILMDCTGTRWYQQNILKVFLCIVEESENTFWVLSDEGQAQFNNILPPSIANCVNFSDPEESKYFRVENIKDFSVYLKNHFQIQMLLPVNLRNTMEICALSQFIRNQNNNAKAANWVEQNELVDLPEQKIGHVLRGPIPVIYLLRDSDPVVIKRLLAKESSKLLGSDNGLDKKDIAVLLYLDEPISTDLLCHLLLRGTTTLNPTNSWCFSGVAGCHFCLQMHAI